MNLTNVRPGTDEHPQVWIGLHLSGPSAPKSSVVLGGVAAASQIFSVQKVYEKIGSCGSAFSDERLLEIFIHSGSICEAVVDTPLTLPPCVTCSRNICPGVARCEDVTVAYMIALEKRRGRMGNKKARHLNPQSQRLWDIYSSLSADDGNLNEPSYSANKAPLVTRGLTLQRRLNSLGGGLVLKETSVPHVLWTLNKPWRLGLNSSHQYRSFEGGLACRQRILARMQELQKVCWESEGLATQIAGSVETFHAFICSFIAIGISRGQVSQPPVDYLAEGGWVYLPDQKTSTALQA